MKTQSKYYTEYTNRYGEEWIFEFNPATRKGILKGSDVDWQEYEVVDGRVDGLLLTEGELKWLRETWKEVRSIHPTT